MQQTHTVDLLFDVESIGLALIVPAATGIAYANQTGGYLCTQSSQEGFLLLIDSEFPYEIGSYFTGDKWGGWCSGGIDEETADWVDNVLSQMPVAQPTTVHRAAWLDDGAGAALDQGLAQIDVLKHLRVDRTKLHDSHEAWLHVQIQGGLPPLVPGTDPLPAILTWENSD